MKHQTRAQKDLKLALEATSEIERKHPNPKDDTKSIYQNLCKEFPTMVMTTGLCQALAFHSEKASKGGDRGEAHGYILLHTAKIMGLENNLFESLPDVITVKLDAVINWARKSSMWPATFGLACCAIEMMNSVSARNDLSRFGAETFRASPRQADVMIVSGRVSRKMAPALRRIYDQMPEPKWVISMGACATSGGVFDNYAIVQGVDKIVPVDVYVPGCPPRPEMLIHAIMMLQEKVMNESVKDRLDTFEAESRQSLVPGTLPVTEGTALERATEIEVANKETSRPYTIPSRHEKRRSS